jgi:2-dehydro-3-deoxyphosphogluconate aldolase/(4S)-4-hydroxy-2-oxoglutarate aldolase
MPTGGVSLDNVADWIKAGCVAVGVSGHLTGIKTASDTKTITDTARKFLEKIRQARA